MGSLRRTFLGSLLLGGSLLALGAGCSVPAHADQVATAPARAGGSRIALGIAPDRMRAPYDVQVIRESGEAMPTYASRDRFYVQGNAGERYVIRVTNPTARRVEAVVTVDGLDVIDGEAGDLNKRGYIVPPYGETQIEGFRTSEQDVATFRFSSVDGSYAGKKGKARNVGVIAVAIFEEQEVARPQVIVQERVAPRGGESYYEGGGGAADDPGAPPPPADAAPAPTSSASRPSVAPGRYRAPEPSSPPRTASVGGGAKRDASDGDYAGQRTERLGLGTEFGEQRYSSVSFTRFVRAASRPVAIAELRYNDAAGLVALGIPVAPLPDAGEVMTRETADPFPGDHRFSRPPGR